MFFFSTCRVLSEAIRHHLYYVHRRNIW